MESGTWYTETVRWAASEGVVTGTSATTFEPDAPVTREQFAAILYRYAQQSGVDVSVGENSNILSYRKSSLPFCALRRIFSASVLLRVESM
ncbi:MAG: S-layer homology domain-containing protein [Agathobaculum sp.]|uniref:S-layer homology domain-containing protein n=1 Tax=Agathobaculum sp. TaxID=2048138 RepID=UPI0025C2960F|nr:S-layer homology domain-containing protein [Agathobaculum sp.]MCI7124757.1 S-layer homology domain-containing protein [Agathobaculum sp.]MDY3712549.1 S-layer homology domain-containing protein [Agathobaculum sp.]